MENVLNKLYSKDYVGLPDSDEGALAFLLGKGLTKEGIYRTVGDRLKLSYFQVGEDEVDIDLVKRVNKDELLNIRIMPMFRSVDTVYFLINDFPTPAIKSSAQRYAKSLGFVNYELYRFVMGFEFDRLVDQIFKDGEISKENFDSSDELRKVDTGFVRTVVRENGVFDPPRVFEELLHRGFDLRASDIHIETLDRGFQVRYRVDGVLSVVDPYNVSQDNARAIINVILTQSGLKIQERKRGQDGRIKDVSYKGNLFDLRTSVVATSSGAKAVLRVLPKTDSISSLTALGFSKFYIDAIQSDVKRHNGLILLTGSVGSGKSTTQRTLLEACDPKDNNIYSIEDPVERTIPYVNHICVKETQVSFEDHLESLLRQDPDVIAIGEIRNLETAEMALKAALSGQLVFATIHTNSALEAFQRLFQMGIEPYALGASLLGISSQRLVRTLCPYCKVKRSTEESEMNTIKSLLSRYDKLEGANLAKFDFIHDACGCDHCNHTGYYSRTVIAEYFSASEDLKSYIASGNVDRDRLLELAESTFVPVEIDALNKLVMGKTTLDEIVKEI